MIDMFFDLRQELEMTKKELETRLLKENNRLYATEASEEFAFPLDIEKRNLLVHHVREDLRDVKRALAKMETGIFGICEETGIKIPIKQLKILPTARTIYDFSVFHFH